MYPSVAKKAFIRNFSYHSEFFVGQTDIDQLIVHLSFRSVHLACWHRFQMEHLVRNTSIKFWPFFRNDYRESAIVICIGRRFPCWGGGGGVTQTKKIYHHQRIHSLSWSSSRKFSLRIELFKMLYWNKNLCKCEYIWLWIAALNAYV